MYSPDFLLGLTHVKTALNSIGPRAPAGAGGAAGKEHPEVEPYNGGYGG